MLRLLSGYWQWVTPHFEGGGGGSETTTSTSAPAPTEAELRAQQLQIEELERRGRLQKEFLPLMREQLKLQGKLLPLQLEQLLAQGELQKASLPIQLKMLEEAGAISTIQLEQLRRQERFQGEAEPLQLAELRRQAAEAKALDALRSPEERARVAFEAEQRAERMGKRQEELADLQLEEIKRGGKATPEQIEQINAATAAAQKTGEADIERFRTETLRQINEEISTASGLRPTDTPIVRLSERAGEEAARQQGKLVSTLAEANAQARLNVPMAQSQITNAQIASAGSLAGSVQNFQAQLAQRAADNRFRLFQPNVGIPSGPGLGFSAFSQPAIGTKLALGLGDTMSPGEFATGLARTRMAGSSTTTNTDKDLGIGELAGGVGGLLQGVSLFL